MGSPPPAGVTPPNIPKKQKAHYHRYGTGYRTGYGVFGGMVDCNSGVRGRNGKERMQDVLVDGRWDGDLLS